MGVRDGQQDAGYPGGVVTAMIRTLRVGITREPRAPVSATDPGQDLAASELLREMARVEGFEAEVALPEAVADVDNPDAMLRPLAIALAFVPGQPLGLSVAMLCLDDRRMTAKGLSAQ